MCDSKQARRRKRKKNEEPEKEGKGEQTQKNVYTFPSPSETLMRVYDGSQGDACVGVCGDRKKERSEKKSERAAVRRKDG